jgi:hypothetical protein
MNHIMTLCSMYTVKSVVKFNYEFRHWIKYYKFPWLVDNRLLVDMLLVLRKVNPLGLKGAKVVPKNVCCDFNKGTCTRKQCKFDHACTSCGGTTQKKLPQETLTPIYWIIHLHLPLPSLWGTILRKRWLWVA